MSCILDLLKISISYFWISDYIDLRSISFVFLDSKMYWVLASSKAKCLFNKSKREWFTQNKKSSQLLSGF